MPRSSRTPVLLVLLAGLVHVTACGPELGDECTDGNDCAVDGTRTCDTTQPGGYCLIPGCRSDECPEEAVCVQFGQAEQARTFCMRHCGDDGDCRGGYNCREPDSSPDAGVVTAIIDESPRGHAYCVARLPQN